MNSLRMNIERDRISSLSDDLIAKILLLIGTKQAVQTSVLSTRWRFIWTKISHLHFSNADFSALHKFHNFFTHVTSYYNNQVEMSLNLKHLNFMGEDTQVFVQKILDHACSQNLKHLTLIGFVGSDEIIPTSMWEFPTLTTLHLENISLCDDNTDRFVGLFSNCINLKNLTIKRCDMTGWDSFTICHPQLSNLTLKQFWGRNSVNVVAPQLKNLTIKNWNRELWISAPDLTSMLYENNKFQLSLNMDSLPSLETVGLCISKYQAGDAYRVVDLLQKFSHVKILTLSLEIFELLSSSVEAIAHQASPFVNLRSLKIYPELYDEPQPHLRKLTMSTEIKNYFLDSSPGASFTMVTREEIRAMRDTKLAQNLMAELRVLLDQENAQLEEDKRLQPLMKMPFFTRKKAPRIHSCYWDDLDDEIKQGKYKISNIVSLVHQIKNLLIKLPTSNKAELLSNLSTLCTEADTLVGKILNRTKIQLETKENSLSVYLRELYAAAQSSS